jgi:sortase A
MRRLVRTVGTLLIVAGVLTLVWALVVWRWQDPFTALYTRYEQHHLSSRYDERFASYRPVKPAGESKRGEAIGRIEVPRLGLNMILVNGTDHDTLMKGPGRDLRTFMPGEGKLVYVAGHRTTYLAPFSHIDSLRPGDAVTVELPYATFHYRVTGHRIVPADDLAVLRSRGREELVLQACHPRFFATHRYLAYARPVRVDPRSGTPYSVTAEAAAASS